MGCGGCSFLTGPTPALPYIGVGVYSDGCGYDWNGAGVGLEGAKQLAGRWDGSRDFAMLFRFDPVPQKCVDQAYNALKSAGFQRIYVTSTTKPRSGEELLPNH